MTDLKTRFQEFVKTLDGFEDINALLKDRDPPGKRRADYLFSNRRIIVEQKVLESDPGDKAQNYVRRLIEENRLAGGCGTFVIDRDTFQDLPDGEKLYRNLLHKTSSRLEKIVSDADKQTKDTREIFGIPDAAGILIILNQGAESLIPELLDYRIRDLFKIDTRNASVRFPHNDMVVVISELHPVRHRAHHARAHAEIRQFDRPATRARNSFHGCGDRRLGRLQWRAGALGGGNHDGHALAEIARPDYP